VTRHPLRLRLLARAAGLVLVAGGVAPRLARGDDRQDVEPVPPLLFFPEPDAEGKKEIETIIDTELGSTDTAPHGRDVLVRRHGLTAVPELVRRIRASANVVQTWNAILTIGTLRRTYGPSQWLWPAIRPIVEVLKSTSGEPHGKVFAALALGTFHGSLSVRRKADSREGTAEDAAKAGEALVDAEKALKEALKDGHAEVSIAAALALAKWGGTGAAVRVREFVREGGNAGQVEPRMAVLIAQGMLPAIFEGDKRDAFHEGLRDVETRVRATSALALACAATIEWEAAEGRTPAAGAQIVSRAQALDAELVFARNTTLRPADRDGAEAVYARGAYAVAAGRTDSVWDELFALAAGADTEPRTAVAAAQALLFAPAQSRVRAAMADQAGRRNAGSALKEPVLAAFLIASASDGTIEGVKAAKGYLSNKARAPTGRAAYDVRYHAALGLVRAFLTGTIVADARAEAVEALDAAHKALPLGDGERTFRSVLADYVKPAKTALLDPGGTLPAETAEQLEALFDDPDGLLAHDLADTTLERLNKMVLTLFGLENLPKPVIVDSGGKRVASKEDQHLRFLLAWLEREPYFARIDFRRDRGRIPASAEAPGRDPAAELPPR
jgi:hypothetical protein